MRLGVAALLNAALLPWFAVAVSSTDQYQDADTAQSGYLPNHNVDPTLLGSYVHSWSSTFNAQEFFNAKPITYTPTGYAHELVIVASQQNIVRVLDGLTGSILYTRTLDPPFQATDSNCGDISPTIGITGTPIVDPETDIMYFFSKGYKGGATGSGTLNGQYKFYAVQLPSLTDVTGFPIILEGHYANNDPTRYFVGGTLLNRPGLAMIGNSVIGGFGGHCDNFNYTGMLVTVSKTTATVTNIQAMVAAPGAPSPQPTNYQQQTGGKAGIWHGGMGLAVNGNNVFFATGNGVGPGVNKVQGTPASGKVYSSTLEQVVANFAVDPNTGSLTQADYFEPYNFDTQLDGGDEDMGSSGVALLDRNTFQAPGVGVAGIAVSSGKDGIVYIMNADNLGGFYNGANGIQDATLQQIVISGGKFYGGVGSYPGEGGYLYFCPTGGPLYAYSYSLDRSGNPLFTLAGQGGSGLACTGNPTVTSLNGQAGTGVVWLADTNAGVVAFNAVPVNGSLTQIPLGWASGRLNRYQRPAFGNARVYTTENNVLYAIGGPAGTAASSSLKPTSTSSTSKSTISSTVSSTSSTLTVSSSTSSSSTVTASSTSTTSSQATTSPSSSSSVTSSSSSSSSSTSSTFSSSSASSTFSSSSASSTFGSSSASSTFSSSSASSTFGSSSTSSTFSSSTTSQTSSSSVVSSSISAFTSSSTTSGVVYPTTGLNPAEPSTISTFNYIGCYGDLVDGTTRSLAANKFVYDPMTLESCAQNCTGYDFFGTEYGRECYCGYTLNATLKATESSCNTPCSGNSSELCGAADRLSTYENKNYIAPPPGPVHKQVVGVYGWIGCYTEATNIRALSSKSFSNNSMTAEQCVNYCSGYTYAGVEYATQCYCGNVINAGSVLAATTNCNMLCGGSSLEYCGAGNRLDMYQQGAVPTTSSSIIVLSTSSTSMSSTGVTSTVSTLSSSTSNPVITSSSSSASSSSASLASSSTGSKTIKSSSTTTSSIVKGTATNPAPIRRTFNWNIAWVNAAPDGHNRPFVGINGEWPLPPLLADIGDIIVINVVNSLGNETTSLHFHGMFQRNATFEDGTAMVAQCPIAPGDTFVYEFTASQSGTYWYHAHVGGQYIDGFRGPLIIRDYNALNNYGTIDQEVILTLTDVYHVEAPYLINYFLSANNTSGAEPVPDSALINEAQNVQFTMIPGKTYLFYIINMGALAGQFLQFDQHNMTIIEADGVYTQPYEVSQIFVAVAQRYAVLIKAMPTITENFAIVSQFSTDMFDESVTPAGHNPTCTAWLVYNPALALPAPFTLTPQPWDDTLLVPWDQQPLWDSDNVQYTYLTVDFATNDWGSNRAMVNGQTYLPQVVPTFFTALTAPAQYQSNTQIYGQVNPQIIPFGSIVEIDLNNHDTRAHPFHLHGHQFQIIARAGNEPQWPGLYSTPAAPMRRDTVVVYPGVGITLRFIANNPGVWLFHCHTEFHVEAGMTATFIEAPDVMVARKPYIPNSHRTTCDSQRIPRTGNAAGNSKNWLDLTGANTEPNATYYGALITPPTWNPYTGGAP